MSLTTLFKTFHQYFTEIALFLTAIGILIKLFLDSYNKRQEIRYGQLVTVRNTEIRNYVSGYLKLIDNLHRLHDFLESKRKSQIDPNHTISEINITDASDTVSQSQQDLIDFYKAGHILSLYINKRDSYRLDRLVDPLVDLLIYTQDIANKVLENDDFLLTEPKYDITNEEDQLKLIKDEAVSNSVGFYINSDELADILRKYNGAQNNVFGFIHHRSSLATALVARAKSYNK